MNLLLIKYIKFENRYNINEVGIMEGQGLNGLILGNSEYYFI